MTETISPLDRFLAERIMRRADDELIDRLERERRGPFAPPPSFTPDDPSAIEEGGRRLGRFFIDTLTVTGEHFLIPSSRRAEWQAFDAQSEETAELLPVPTWAVPVAELSHLEFEMPEEILK